MDVDAVMKAHPNYKSTAEICERMKDEEKDDTEIKEVKFIAAAANRTAYHATQPRYCYGYTSRKFSSSSYVSSLGYLSAS